MGAKLSVEGHPLLQQLSQRHAGLRKIVTSSWLRFDQTVMQQLIEWREASANAWRRLVRALGSPVTENHDLMFPPSYETIATMDLSVFQAGGTMKRGAVIELGRLGHRIDTWQEGSLTDLRHKLLSIPGIGPWTVDHCLGFSLAAPDAVPLGDYQLPHIQYVGHSPMNHEVMISAWWTCSSLGKDSVGRSCA